jgi:hypothetical protein
MRFLAAGFRALAGKTKPHGSVFFIANRSLTLSHHSILAPCSQLNLLL